MFFKTVLWQKSFIMSMANLLFSSLTVLVVDRNPLVSKEIEITLVYYGRNCGIFGF